jgi:hypothetical protein
MQDVNTSFLKNPWLNFGMIGAPIIWSVHFLIVWLLVEFGCAVGLANTHWFGVNAVHATVLLATVAAAGLIVFSGIIAYRRYQRLQSLSSDEQSRFQREVERARFMAVVGMAFSVLFLVVVIYVALPAFVLPPCNIANL